MGGTLSLLCSARDVALSSVRQIGGGGRAPVGEGLSFAGWCFVRSRPGGSVHVISPNALHQARCLFVFSPRALSRVVVYGRKKNVFWLNNVFWLFLPSRRLSANERTTFERPSNDWRCVRRRQHGFAKTTRVFFRRKPGPVTAPKTQKL